MVILRQAQGDLPLPPPEGDTSNEVVGNGSQPFRRVDEQREGKSDEQRATSDLPLPPPAGDTSEEVVGNGSQPFRRVDEQREGKSNEQRATSNE